MSDEGEKTCPLCAEEMDLTDQQLKPCKCGYEICVWCWHHIMDMAEKDETEGRCPACRNPYNKEKIVGTAAKCERLVLGMNVEKKLKSHKGKVKTSEGRKQLESVRVIQRNLVYVVGLPLDFADEDLLQRNDYFGKYGNVLKVSISRTATGAIQQFANSTSSVYITYSKEEEAVRCIQSVHGFALDGRSLRACFGTTKYCHAWLRNVPCTNQDCLYLHETGSQEDSFTKDEIISAYTRSRVQQITSSSNSMQRRSGNVLPPPADEHCNNNSSASSGKPITKAPINTNNSGSSARVSPPNSSSGRSAALPAGASWATRPASTIQTLPRSTPPNQKHEMCNGQVALSKKVPTTSQVSLLPIDTGKKKIHAEETIVSREKPKTKMETFDAKEKKSNINVNVAISDSSIASVHLANSPSSRQPHSPPTTNQLPDTSNIADSSILSCGPISDKNSIDHTDGSMENACSSILSMSIHENKQFQNGHVEHIRESLLRQPSGKAANTTGDVCVASVQSDYELGMQTNVTQVDWPESEDDVLSFDNQRINDPEISTRRVPDFSHVLNFSKHSNIHSHEFNDAGVSVGIGTDRQVVDRNGNLMAPTSNFHSRHPENVLNSFEDNNADNFNLFPSNGRMSLLRGYENEASGAAVGLGENNIISNILSMDFDPWDESLTSPQNISKFVGDTARQGPLGVPGSWKTHNSNQSRFSFAREGEPISHVSGSGQSTDFYEQASKQQRPFGQDMSRSNGLLVDKSLNHNGLPFFSGTEPDNVASSQFHISSNKLLASRSQISAPPGFSGPSRAAPPPGFNSHERTEPIFESLSVAGNHMLDASSLLRNQYQGFSSSNTFSNGDIEFIDPAILAVGKGTLPCGINPGLETSSNFSPQLNTYEDTRFQSLLQRSLPPHQNQRYTDMGNSFSNLGNAYGVPSRIMDQTMPPNNFSQYSQFNPTQPRNGITSNGQWNGWNEAQSGNNLDMAELLRNERLAFNKFYGGYEDPKIQSQSSGNLYNRNGI